MKRDSLNDEPLIRSRLKWVVNLLMVLSIAIIELFVIALVMGSTLVSDILDNDDWFRHFVPFLSFPLASGIILWFMRRVTVYADRVEVRFPLHRKWNYDVSLKDVHSYCLELREVTNDNGDINITSHYYLQEGRKLWLFVEEGLFCSNYYEMIEVLEKDCHIPQRKGTIDLDVKDKKKVRRGEYILLEDADDEELAVAQETTSSIKACERVTDPPLTRLKMKKTKNWDDNLKGWKLYAFIVIVFLVIFGLLKGGYFLLTANPPERISCLSATTPLPKNTQMVIDYIDVDTVGIWLSENRDVHNNETPMGEQYVNTWAFRVKGRNKMWIVASVCSYEKDNMTKDQLMACCIRELHSQHDYQVIDNKYKLMLRTKYWRADESDMLISCKEPWGVGHARFWWDKKEKRFFPKHKRKNVMREAAEDGVALFQYIMGEDYASGNGVEKNVEEALRWLGMAATQEKDFETKIEALNEMSYIYADLQDYKKALEIIEKAIELKPDEANLYNTKGEHLYKSGDVEGAHRMWRKVLGLDPQFQKNHDSNLAKMLSEGKK